MSRNMKTMKSWMLGPLLVAACAGTKLHDVGDIPGEGGAAGTSDGGDPDSGGQGGSNRPLPPDWTSAGEGSTGGSIVVGPGGTGGSIDIGPGGAGPSLLEVECDACEVVAAAPDIRDVATNSERVFWLEYGTFDDLGNHQDDGRLMAMPLAGGEPEVIVADLQGPLELELSEDAAYVLIERSGHASGGRQLMRVALEDGAEQRLQAVPEPGPPFAWDLASSFATGDSAAFWFIDGTIYRLPEGDPGPADGLLETDLVFALHADDTQLYLQDVEGIKVVPFVGGTATLIKSISTPNDYPESRMELVSDGFVYSYEGSYLVRMPTTGGNWKRVASMLSPIGMKLDGDAYFNSGAYWQNDYAVGNTLFQSDLSSPESQETLVIGPWGPFRAWRGWDISADSVYFGYGNELYRVPRAD